MSARRQFSASELVELKLPGLPATRARCSDFISDVARSVPELVQSRAGRGGGWVVDIAALPPEARAALAAREQAAVLAEHDEVQALDRSKRQLAVAGVADLTARQRAIMEARSVILLAIEARALTGGLSRSAAISAFAADLAQGRLSPEQIAIVRRANDRCNDARQISVARPDLSDKLP